ncbi:hypothetical protein HDU79_009173 [Rhizoclosmatium sp. JEL0117]|nr:hypothetical protein HDU79_009173 [Rhizoclosmatium sp. JEL0117]
MDTAIKSNFIFSTTDPLKNLVNLRHKASMNQRKLMKPYANWIHIWGFVTGAVISGEFSGFNAGYSYGLGSMIIAHFCASILMITVSLNLVELTTAMPFSSGCVSFAKAAFGGAAGCAIGIAYTFDMVFIGAEVTQFLGVTLGNMFGIADSRYTIAFWAISVLLCWVLNVQPKVFFNVITLLSAVSVVLVIAPLFALVHQFDFSEALQTVLGDSSSVTTMFLPTGISGVVQSFPLALYLLICFECLPVAVEETDEMEGQTMMWGMAAANFTLLGVSWIVLLVCAGMPPGAINLSSALLPYSAILQQSYPNVNQQVISFVSIPGIFASQLSIFYACSRYFYGMSRSGYLPSVISVTNRYGAPWVSMIMTAVLWIALSFVLQFFPNENTSNMFLALGTIFALLAYIMQPVVYIRLHYLMPNLPRPFKIPYGLGLVSAGVNLTIALFFLLGMLFYNRNWQWGLLGILIGIAYLVPVYYFLIRNNLANSPDKLFIAEQLKLRMSNSTRRSINNPKRSSERRSSSSTRKRFDEMTVEEKLKYQEGQAVASQISNLYGGDGPRRSRGPSTATAIIGSFFKSTGGADSPQSPPMELNQVVSITNPRESISSQPRSSLTPNDALLAQQSFHSDKKKVKKALAEMYDG